MPSALLLMLAICSVWLPALPLPAGRSFAPWLPLLVLALALGLHDGQLDAIAVAGIVLLGFAARGTTHAPHAWQRRSLLAFTLLLALLLALHRWPGFHNVLVIPSAAITADARPFMLFANLDKGSAGLLLLALLAPRCHAWREWRESIARTLLPGIATIVLVMGVGWFTGLVKPALKWPGFTVEFLAINLLLTVVAEEAFFRGVIQQPLQSALQGMRGGSGLALMASALLFGAAHFGGGMTYAAIAGLAGLGYAWVFQRSGRIEAPILLHFTLNAVHFLAFTYPALA
ncbi:CPBP family intramembrane glutamic endopeptidase [Herbaspirillum huttiense]|uniref:CPBP family intramembrane glutamic endopeptidase n=1 Tax=Herbaspirillum huttiense TaxID=863372 RepID=UPI002176A460|nr:CPBP family intramembrane glutamic endopeptidase [Herbaspirillum huttiense]UWE15700.1 CPBP family intramembrane metalloprotease [Herbaspirillum huttiense]